MYKRFTISQSAIFSVLCLILLLPSSVVLGADTSAGKEQPSLYQIAKIDPELSGDSLTLHIIGNAEPAYTVSERFSPFRVVLDIADAAFDPSIDPKSKLLPDNAFVSLQTSLLTDQDPTITRFEFTIAETHDYKITREGKSINVKVTPATGGSSAKQPMPGTASGESVAITDIVVKTSPQETIITLAGSGPITKYTSDTVTAKNGEKPQMYIDIADINIAELIREKQIGTSVESVRVEQRDTGGRFFFKSASTSLFDYKITNNAGQVVVTIKESPDLPKKDMTGTAASDTTGKTDKTLDSLIGETENILAKGSESKETAGKKDPSSSLEDTFSFAGYEKQRISVDFYKIDLHNVFRLFRQFTDLNIIVDETVEGSLTLALTDVPWDFALDIICNLKDLKKEERFNTIVIYPNKKEFAWPDRLEDNLSVEADTEIVEQDAFIIEQSANLPKEILQAQELLRKAQLADENEDFEDAATLYEQASKLWPDNVKILNRLATLYLVNLRVNAKAVHFAKESLAKEPGNNRAALYAAIGSANMQRNAEALEYFTQSISATPPMKEALISFATFCETSGQNEQAIKLLDKYNASYGETMDTMIAKARIYDKLGDAKMAVNQYKALLASGFPLPPDLKKYIHGRLAASNF